MFRQVFVISCILVVFVQWEMISGNRVLRSQITACGESLSKTLYLICDGKFNSPFKKSHGSWNSYGNELQQRADPESSNFKLPFHSKDKALSILEYRIVKRGVMDECCRKSCNLDEIKSYCSS
uniref:Insulin-like peptide 3 n=1 Tax=Pyrrhocoris apterus TaxID=37000 RepID=A0A6G7NUR9_PYRAP|nr:insulin-like peptide 3 [Pyrrhocoris apterus]